MPSLASRRPAHPRPHPRPRGFTLIELLIVTIIILVLAAIGLSVGSSVSRSGKAQATKQVLAVLDQSLSEYIQAKGTPPPAYHTDAAGRVFPLIDAVVVQEEYAQDSVAAYVMALSEVPSAAAIIERLDSEFIRAYAGPRPGNIDVKNMLFWPVGGGQVVFGPLPAATTDTPIRTILDGYGNPIRFVHPEFHGGYGYLVASQRRTDATALSFGPPPSQTAAFSPTFFRRSARPTPNLPADADEGLCTAGRPYFYSAGPDGDPGTRDDNIYHSKPTFPPESVGLDVN